MSSKKWDGPKKLTVLELMLAGAAPEEAARLRERLGRDTELRLLPVRPGADPARPGDEEAAALEAEIHEKLAAGRPAGLSAPLNRLRRRGPLDPGLGPAVLRGLAPARSAAQHLSATADPEDELAAELRELTARHLGADPQRWLGLLDALPTHRAALPALLAAAPAPDPEADRNPEDVPSAVAATVRMLLEHSEPKAAAAVLPALPAALLDSVLGSSPRPGPTLLEAVAEHGDTRSRITLAGHDGIDAALLKRLIAAADPAVDAAAYRSRHSTDSLRRLVAARTPLDPAFRTWLLGPHSTQGGQDRRMLSPLIGCGDPQLTARAFSYGPRVPAQLYALARVLELHGRDGLRIIAKDPDAPRHFKGSVARRLNEVLASTATPAAAAAELRAEAEPYHDPAALPRQLNSSVGQRSLRNVLHEPYTYDLPALHAEHKARPFSALACETLLRHEDATAEQRELFRNRVLNEVWWGGKPAVANLSARERLAAEGFTRVRADWLLAVVRAGQLPAEDLIDTVTPAHQLLGGLAELAGEPALGPVFRLLHQEVDAHLTGHPEAWAMFAHAHPTFTGSIRELLTVCGQVAGEKPDPSSLPTPVEPAYEPPVAPVFGRDAQHYGPAALDLLRELAEGEPPLPEDPGAVAYLSAVDRHCLPGGGQWPRWLLESCSRHGLPVPEQPELPSAPEKAELLDRLRRLTIGPDSNNQSNQTPEQAARGRDRRAAEHQADQEFLAGRLGAEDLLATLPVPYLRIQRSAHLTPSFARELPALTVAWLKDRLGDDPAAWLRAAVLRSTAPDLRDRTWPELLAAPDAPDAPNDPGNDLETLLGLVPALLADTPEVRKDRRLSNPAAPPELPLSDVLVHAPRDVLDELLPRMDGRMSWFLARHLMGHRPLPEGTLSWLLDHPEPRALNVLARGCRLLPDELLLRLVELNPPESNHVLFRESSAAVRRRVVQQPEPITDLIREDLKQTVWARQRLVEMLDDALGAADPELVELVFEYRHRALKVPQQLAGCLALLRGAGPEAGPVRLAALLDSGTVKFGKSVLKACREALAAPDPEAVLAAAAERRPLPAIPRRKASPNVSHAFGDYMLRVVDWTPDDLLQEARPAAWLLHYLAGARHRPSAPPVVHDTLALLRETVRDRLGADPEAWQRLYARASQRVRIDPQQLTVAELLAD